MLKQLETELSEAEYKIKALRKYVIEKLISGIDSEAEVRMLEYIELSKRIKELQAQITKLKSTI